MSEPSLDLPEWRPAAVRVPGSSSNLGAGFDCLGIAVDLWLEAKLAPGSGPSTYAGTLEQLDPSDDLITTALREEGVPPTVHVEARSQIPLSRGLGSSAAAIVAGYALASLGRRQPLDLNELYRRAVAHEGHPDNAGPAIFGGLILAFPGGGQEGGGGTAISHTSLPVHPDIGVALAVPDRPVETRVARDLLPPRTPRDWTVDQAARAAALVSGLAEGKGELIRIGMEDRIGVPVRKTLIPGYDAAVAAGLQAGAYGVTISGSGSTLVALTSRVKRTEVAQAIADALTAHDNPATAIIPGSSRTGVTALAE